MPRYNRTVSEDGLDASDDRPERLPPAPPARRVRQRAPRRPAGRRAQIAVDAGTTPNDVLVQLAAERLHERRRRDELQARAERRWRAFREAAPTPGASAEPLSDSELVALSRTMREDA